MPFRARTIRTNPASLLAWQIFVPVAAFFAVLVLFAGFFARAWFEPQAKERDLSRVERYAKFSAAVFQGTATEKTRQELKENFRAAGVDTIELLPPSHLPAWSSPRYLPVGPQVEAWAAFAGPDGSPLGAVHIRQHANAVATQNTAVRTFAAASCATFVLLLALSWILFKLRVTDRLETIAREFGTPSNLPAAGSDVLEQAREAIEQRLSEAQRKEHQLQLLLEGHSELANISTPDGRLVDVNPAYCRFFGKTREDLIGTNCLDLVPPTDRMEVIRHLQSVARDKRAEETEHALIAHDGSTSWFRWNASAIPDPESKAEQIVSFRADITAQKHAEKQLEDLRRAFDQMQSLAQTGSLTWDLAGDQMEWTGEARRLLGVDTSAIPSLERLLDTVAPKDRSSVRQLFEKARDEGRDFEHEFSVVLPDGTLRVIQSRAEVLADPKTKLLTRLTCTLRDITTLREAEAATKRELRFRQAVEQSMRVGIVVSDEGGRNLSVNAAFCGMTGWSEKELIGISAPYPYWPEEEIPTINAAFKTAIAGKTPPEGFELKFCRKDGTRFDVLVRVAPLLDSEDNRLGWLGAVTDVSSIQETRRRLAATESALRTELRFREALESSVASGAVAVDDQGRILSANRAFCKMTGLPENAIIGLVPPYPWWPEKDRAAIGETLTAAVTGHSPEDGYELRFQNCSGDVFDVLVKVAPLKDSEGIRFGWLSSITDISSIKRTQHSLAKTERELRIQLRYRDAVEKSVTVGLIGVGTDGRPFSANDALVKMLGFTEEEFKQMTPPYPYWPAEEQAEIQRAFDLDLMGQSPREGFQLRFRRKDGRVVDVLVTASRLTSPDGKTLGMLSAITDITALQEARRELQVANERLRIAQDVAELGIWDWSPNTDTLFWDRNSFAIFGHPEATEPKTVWEMIHDQETRERLTQGLKRLIDAGGRSGQDHLKIRWPDGSMHEILSTYVILRDESDCATRVFGVNRDVTTELEEQSELRNAKERLSAALEGGKFGTFEHVVGVGDLNYNPTNYEINGIDPSITEPGALFAAWKETAGEFYGKLMATMTSLPKTKNTYTYEFTARPRGKEPRGVRVSVYIERDDHGQPVRLVGITRRIEA